MNNQKINIFKNDQLIYWLGLLVLLLVVLLTTFYKIESNPLWSDESRTLDVYCAQPFDVSNGDPPLFPFVISSVSSFSKDLFWLRFLNALAIIATTMLIAKYCAKWFSCSVAWWAALAFATSYMVISRANWVRPYAFAVLFSTLSYILFYQFLETRKLKYIIANTIVNILILYTQYSGFVIVLNQLVFGIIYFALKSKDKINVKFLFWNAITLASALPWYCYLYFNRLKFIRYNGVHPPKDFDALRLIYHIIVKVFPRANPEQVRLHTVVVLLVIVFGIFVSLFKKQYLAVSLLVSWIVSSAGFLCLCLYFDKISMNQRYYMLFVPALYLLVFNGIQQIAKISSIKIKYNSLMHSMIFLIITAYIFMPAIKQLSNNYLEK